MADTLRSHVRRAIGAPRRLDWHERHRHRFLHEYHEMKARAGAELYQVGDRLTWSGQLPVGETAVEWAIQYHPAHPSVAPTVFVMDPALIATALGADRKGRVRVITGRGWHSGLTAYDLWRWLKDRVDALHPTTKRS